MSEEKTHDLYDFMQQISDKMAANYKQIQKRATEDPGTAGDQGEENWADLLRGWLPRTYEVVTKGRIISQDGHVSPQVDVLVLKSIYPKQLIDEGQKIYLAAGVAAAFECKTTLKAAHIAKAMETCVKIKNLYPVREGTPYKELHTPIVYGLLAHSHSWKVPNSKPEDNIELELRKSEKMHVFHPRLGLDLLSVANLTTWTLFKVTNISFPFMKSYDQEKLVMTSYFKHFPSLDVRVEHFTPIGTLVSNLIKLLAWEDPLLRDLADYYWSTKITGDGDGLIRRWQGSVYSAEVRKQVETLVLRNTAWDEWNGIFPYAEEEEEHPEKIHTESEESDESKPTN